MNYYPFHIGDYASHTRGLSLLEDLAYRRLMDEYYLSEQPLNGRSTDVARLIGMAEHGEVVAYVLGRYFENNGDTWTHERIEKELETFKKKQESASAAGKASAESRRNKGKTTNAERPLNTRSTPVEHPSTNQEPITNISTTNVVDSRKRNVVQKPVDVSQEVWDSFSAIRKAKRAPISQIAIDGISREANKAGVTLEQALTVCCERGWQSFKAEYVKQSAQLNGRPLTAAENYVAQKNAMRGNDERTVNGSAVRVA